MIDVYCVKVGNKYDRSFVEKLKNSYFWMNESLTRMDWETNDFVIIL